MNLSENKALTRQAAINGLAVFGFVTLVTFGIMLAVYSTRFVPNIVNGAGAAAVFLGSVFTPAEEPGLSVVPTTISFNEASSTVSANTISTPTTTTPSTPLKKNTTTAGNETSGVFQINGTSTAPVFSGLPDFVVIINEVGYLETASASSFVASSTIYSGNRPAINFTIKNIGTNATGQWCFSASIPTSTNPIYESSVQQSLNPGDYIDYTLGFDQAISGTDKMISITANIADSANPATCAHAVAESNTDNNSASTKVTIIGS